MGSVIVRRLEPRAEDCGRVRGVCPTIDGQVLMILTDKGLNSFRAPPAEFPPSRRKDAPHLLQQATRTKILVLTATSLLSALRTRYCI